jgi:hypothetical protein
MACCRRGGLVAGGDACAWLRQSFVDKRVNRKMCLGAEVLFRLSVDSGGVEVMRCQGGDCVHLAGCSLLRSCVFTQGLGAPVVCYAFDDDARVPGVCLKDENSGARKRARQRPHGDTQPAR